MGRLIKYKNTFTHNIEFDGKDKVVSIWKIKNEPEEYEFLVWDSGDIEHLSSHSNAENVAIINLIDKDHYSIAMGDSNDIVVNPLPENEYLDYLKKNKIATIANMRYDTEINGCIFSGMKIKTDRESQAMITGAALQAVNDNNYTCNWKMETGFVTLNSATIIAVAKAVREHVQKCFDKENQLIAAVINAENENKLNEIEIKFE